VTLSEPCITGNYLNPSVSRNGSPTTTTTYTTTKEYDARGNVISQTDPLGRKTKMDYDSLNRLIKTTDPATPVAGITQQRYDTRDNLIIVIDAKGSQTQYRYDRANRMTQEIRPLVGQDNTATTYQYDSNGNLIGRVSALKTAKGSSLSLSH
jgi:YD repeat-containing protein